MVAILSRPQCVNIQQDTYPLDLLGSLLGLLFLLGCPGKKINNSFTFTSDDHCDGLALTPPCVAESDQRHAQHPLKMLGIDFSCGSYQTNSERIMLLNSWYQIDMSLYSNRYLFVRSKIGGQKWQPYILCKTMSFFASRLRPWFAWQPRAPAQKTTHADMQILYSLLSQYLRHSVLNNVRGRYEKCIVPGNKDFWIR